MCIQTVPNNIFVVQILHTTSVSVYITDIFETKNDTSRCGCPFMCLNIFIPSKENDFKSFNFYRKMSFAIHFRY